MDKEINWTLYRKRRMWLTKFWMGLVVFNAFLHLEVVESWFNSQIQTQNVEIVSQLNCLKFTTLDTHQTNDKYTTKFSLNIVLLNPNPSSISLPRLVAFEFLQKNLNAHFTCTGTLQSIDDLALTSGLSPPEFS